jgi:hypothetical protein
MTTHALSRFTLGVAGLAGAVLLLAWLVGWAVFGVHAAAFHALVPAGLVLLLLQGVRRVNADGND